MDPFASVGGSPEASKSGASESEVTPPPSTRFGRAPDHGRTTSAGPFHRTKSGRTADTVWEPPGFVREGHELVSSTAITAPAGSTLPGRVTGNRSPHVTSPALQLEPIQPMIFTSSNQATEPPWPVPDPPSPGSEVQFPVIVLGGGDLGGGFGGTLPPGVDWDPVRPCDCPPPQNWMPRTRQIIARTTLDSFIPATVIGSSLIAMGILWRGNVVTTKPPEY